MGGSGANYFTPLNELSQEGERIPFSIFSSDLAESNGHENEWGGGQGEGLDPQPFPPLAKILQMSTNIPLSNLICITM